METKCPSTFDQSDIKLTSSKYSLTTEHLAKVLMDSNKLCRSVEQKYETKRSVKKGISMPTLRMQKIQRTLKQRLQDYGKKLQRKSNRVSRRQSRMETMDQAEERRKLQLFSLAVDSICKSKGVVDIITKERPGASVEYMRHFKYIHFDKAIELVEEFNALMRILVKKEMKVDVSSVLPRRTSLFHPHIRNPPQDLI